MSLPHWPVLPHLPGGPVTASSQPGTRLVSSKCDLPSPASPTRVTPLAALGGNSRVSTEGETEGWGGMRGGRALHHPVHAPGRSEPAHARSSASPSRHPTTWRPPPLGAPRLRPYSRNHLYSSPLPTHPSPAGWRPFSGCSEWDESITKSGLVPDWAHKCLCTISEHRVLALLRGCQTHRSCPG